MGLEQEGQTLQDGLLQETVMNMEDFSLPFVFLLINIIYINHTYK